MANTYCFQTLAAPIWMLNKIGLWPAKNLNFIIVLKLVFNSMFGVISISIVLHNIIIAIRKKNSSSLNWMTNILIPITNLCAKIIPLWINIGEFYLLLDDLKSDAFNIHSEKLNRHVQKVERISRLIIRYFALAMAIFLWIFSVMPFFTNVPLMIPASFNTEGFEILYKFAHLFATSYLGISSASIDVFFMSLIGLCTAQLDILEEKLTNILEYVEDYHESSENKKPLESMVQNYLKECIILHETIIRVTRKLSVILSFPLFVQYFYGCIVICNVIIQILILGEGDSRSIIGLCAYSGVLFAQMSAYHWLGNEIIFKSDQLIQSCYLSKWYELDLTSQRYIIILMERAKRPLVITLYELVFVSLSSLGVVVQWSYSLFALIKARYN